MASANQIDCLAVKRIISAARGELGSAIAQFIPSDDQINANHVRVAHALLNTASELLDEAIKRANEPKAAA